MLQVTNHNYPVVSLIQSVYIDLLLFLIVIRLYYIIVIDKYIINIVNISMLLCTLILNNWWTTDRNNSRLQVTLYNTSDTAPYSIIHSVAPPDYNTGSMFL